MIRNTLAGLVALVVVAGAGRAHGPEVAATPDVVLLKGATVHTVSGETLSPGEVLIEHGKITQVAKSVAVRETPTTLDLTGLHLYPGLIDTSSSLGLAEIGAVRATLDTDEVGEYHPEVLGPSAVNPDSELIPVARANGLTHVLTQPMGGIVSGQSGLVALTGWTHEQMTVKMPVAMHVFWPRMGLDTTPEARWKGEAEFKPLDKQDEERRKKVKEIDAFFEEAKAYDRAREAARASPGGKTGIPDDHLNPSWEAMRPVVRGEIPLMIHADELRQIKSALAWADSKGLKNIVLAGAAHADQIAAQIAEKKIPVLYQRTFEQPTRDYDPYDIQFRAPEVLRKAGVKVAFSMGPGSWYAAEIRNLPYHAAHAMAFGLPREEALRGITLYPAQILGVADRLGSIEPGKEATLFAADGDILDIRTNVKRMWIAGQEVSLESRHTKLYEKYKGRPKGD